MKFDEYGIPTYDESELLELIYNNKDITEISIEKTTDIEQYLQAVNKFYIKNYELHWEKPKQDPIEYHKSRQEFLMPPEYKNIDLEKELLNLCNTDEERDRVQYEMKLFRKNDLVDVLKLLKYITDVMKKNEIVWGVGRGSSVASYVLYLIGIHKVNSIKYNLDIKEFIRNGTD